MNYTNLETFDTIYGKISLYKNEKFIINDFKNGKYWDIDTFLKLKQIINPNRNILEIGGHCGTSTILYASILNKPYKVYVYEPQKNMFDLLLYNIKQNNLENKIIAYNKAVFCDNIVLNMNNIDLDGGRGIVSKRYNEESNLKCNFGGIGLGVNGEKVNAITIDEMKHDNIGFIHCDAQGAENHIFSKATNMIKNNRPIIFFENNEKYGKYLYNNVCKSYPKYNEFSKFNLEKYCLHDLKYSHIFYKYGNQDDLLIP